MKKYIYTVHTETKNKTMFIFSIQFILIQFIFLREEYNIAKSVENLINILKNFKELDKLLEKAKLLSVDVNQEVQDIDEEMSMHCVTCGHEIHTRTAVKHMEKCFNKVCFYNFCIE